jgi:uncharacterized Tic20 family protein
MQHSNQENPTGSDHSEALPSNSADEASFRVRSFRAAIAGTVATILYLLIFRKSYAAVVGDTILWAIKGDEYYLLGYKQIDTLVHSINAILWLLMGAIPFLILKRTTSGILLLIGITFGLVLCGCLIIIVAVSPMWP